MVALVSSVPGPSGGRGGRLVELSAQIAALQAEMVAVVAELDAAGDHTQAGFDSTVAWLRAHPDLRMSRAAAQRWVRLGRRLRPFPATAAAFAAGLSLDHVDLLAAAACRLPADYARDEPVLLEAAGRLDPDRLAKTLRYWRWRCDPDTETIDAAALHAARNLHLTPQHDGTVRLDADLDPEGAGWVTQAVDAYAERLWRTAPADDTTTAAQRRADALVEIARAALGCLDGHTKQNRVRPGLHLFAPLTDLAPAGDANPQGPITVDELLGIRRETEHGYPITTATLQRLACDADIDLTILAADGLPLYLGRSLRTATHHQRLALEQRDQGCAAPGCHRPAPWCHAHHLHWWEHDGPTNIDNLALLCNHHHRLVHEHHWTATRQPDGTLRLEPP